MQLPLIRHIDIPNLSWAHVQQEINLFELTHRPLVFSISTSFKSGDLSSFLNDLYNYMLHNKLHPLCPYPLYIKTTLPIKDHRFFIIDTHFQFPTQIKTATNLKEREVTILQKIEILIKKLKNCDLFNNFQDIQMYSQRCKQLKDISLQQDFYTRIVNSWTE